MITVIGVLLVFLIASVPAAFALIATRRERFRTPREVDR
jgi:hypothetical protein